MATSPFDEEQGASTPFDEDVATPQSDTYTDNPVFPASSGNHIFIHNKYPCAVCYCHYMIIQIT